jgi:head-tail adaptor
MTALLKGELNRRVRVLRAEQIDDGMASVPGPHAEIGKRWAKKTDVSDAERVRASQAGMTVTTRFLVRSDALTRSIGGSDRLECEGTTYEVTGAKEWGGRNVGVEITATTEFKPPVSDPAP